ncbi:MAG: N5-glutamine S-adenosyl-L-methionine-dependent methyltransferase [Methanobacterium sp. PtaB.Bin024]|nr:MAG: N5-glutamine S-adenosyl-L-methionine-dependent methyltransferase [Methanobacterium sp. PtaB.Bin024]
MSKFEKSEWAEKKHAKEFMENADVYILERKRLFKILKSFYRHFLLKSELERSIKVLDLGCGNGALTMELVKEDDEIQATLVDGSSEMLKNARENLKTHSNMDFIHKTFQELLKSESEGDDLLVDKFDLVVSSLAIHHLHLEEKKSFFRYVYNHLNPGGFFLNIDVVKAPVNELESWYRVLWSEWIRENQDTLETKTSFEYLPLQYKNNPDNHPDKLQDQLDALKSVGFQQADCYYKYGIFSVYGGKK